MMLGTTNIKLKLNSEGNFTRRFLGFSVMGRELFTKILWSCSHGTVSSPL